MFDPQTVDRDMDRIFVRAGSAGRVERPSTVNVLSVAPSGAVAPAAGAPKRARSRIGGKGLALALLIAVPVLALVLYEIAFRPSSDGRRSVAATTVRPAQDAGRPQAATDPAPQREAAAYAVVAQRGDGRIDAVHSHRGWRRARRAARDAARDAAIEEDASVTRRLNEAAIDAPPVLGYAQGVIDQSAPR